MSKRGLGKGLDALIPETEKSAKDNSSVNKMETEKEVVKEVIKEKLEPLNKEDIITLSTSLDSLLTIIKKF